MLTQKMTCVSQKCRNRCNSTSSLFCESILECVEEYPEENASATLNGEQKGISGKLKATMQEKTHRANL